MPARFTYQLLSGLLFTLLQCCLVPLFAQGQGNDSLPAVTRHRVSHTSDSTKLLRVDSLKGHVIEENFEKYDTLSADSIKAMVDRIIKSELERDSGGMGWLLQERALRDSLVQDSIKAAQVKKKKSQWEEMPTLLPAWTPNPTTATWLAMVFPGAGQIYNRKFWKLPIIYGGFVGCIYAIKWNGQMYNDYQQAYQDIMDSDPNTASYLNFLPPTYDVSAHEEYLKKIFKSRKDRYRRYRDLSVFAFIGVYIVSVIDAYVDAELSVFDISKELGVKIEPGVIENREYNTRSIGVQCSINF